MNTVTPQVDRKSAHNGSIILVTSCHFPFFFLMTEIEFIPHVKSVGSLLSNIDVLNCSTAAMRYVTHVLRCHHEICYTCMLHMFFKAPLTLFF